jgi:hypothetical protein
LYMVQKSFIFIKRISTPRNSIRLNRILKN